MIYVLEDDANIRKLVDYALTREGYSVEGFGTPADFWAAVGRQLPQLVLLDIMLPQEDGLSVLQKLRSRFGYPAPAGDHAHCTQQRV